MGQVNAMKRNMQMPSESESCSKYATVVRNLYCGLYGIYLSCSTKVNRRAKWQLIFDKVYVSATVHQRIIWVSTSLSAAVPVAGQDPHCRTA